MMIHDFAQRLLNELEARIKTKTTGILNGNLSPEEYRTATGHYQALAQTVAFIKELAKKAENDE